MTKRGHQKPEKDNWSKDNDQLDVSSEIPTPEMPTASRGHFVIPESAAIDLKLAVRAIERDYDRLDAQGIYTSEEIRKKLGGVALSPEDIESQEIAEISKRAGQGGRPKRDRRKLGPHQQNVADGRKRVEDTYREN